MRSNKKIYRIFLSSFLTTVVLFPFIHFWIKLSKKTNIPTSPKFVNNNWLDKYKNDKNFTNCDFFNSYKNGDLIKKALIKQFLYQTKIAFNEFQEYILKTYQNLKFTYSYIDYFSDSYQTQINTITFDQNYFDQINNEINWDKFFDKNELTFIPQTSYFLYLCSEWNSEKQVKAYFLNDKIDGIYYIDNKDKNNENNKINQNIKKKVNELKTNMNYAKKQLHTFMYSLTQSFLSNNEELNSFLSQIVANAKESLDYTILTDENLNKNLSEQTKKENYSIRKKFFDWIEDTYNITTSITVEDYALVAMNHFENFFTYLSFHKKDYFWDETIDFKKAIVDFLKIARKNLKITALEKAVASYIFAARNNKTIVYFDLEEFIFKNWNSIMWKIVGAVGIFGLGGFVSSLISSTVGATSAMGGSISNTLTLWFSNFWGGLFNFFGEIGLTGGKAILTNSTSVTLPVTLGGIATTCCTIKINKKNTKNDIKTNVEISDVNVINVNVDTNDESEETKINGEMEKKMLQILSKHGISKKNNDIGLDENMITNINIQKIDEVKNNEDIIKTQDHQDEVSNQRIKNLIKEWIVKKFNKKNLVYYREDNIDWVDVEKDISFFKMIINHLENFNKHNKEGHFIIKRIPLKWVLKAILKIVKKDSEVKQCVFFDDQLIDIIFDCFIQKEVNENNVNQKVNQLGNKIITFDNNKGDNKEHDDNIIYENNEEDVSKQIKNNNKCFEINNKDENSNDNIKNKKKLQNDIIKKIFTMLDCAKIKCEKNLFFDKKWSYKFKFTSLPNQIKSKIKNDKSKEYISFSLILKLIIETLREDKQISTFFTYDELNLIISDKLFNLLEENRELSDGKNEFIIKIKNNKNDENNKKEKSNVTGIKQKFQKNKENINAVIDNSLVKNYVVDSIMKIFNNRLPIIWLDNNGNWIKVSSLPDEIQSKIEILKENAEIKYVTLQLVLKAIIETLKEDAKINSHFQDDELKEIIVTLCNKKNVKISHYFPTKYGNYENGIAKIINLIAKKYYGPFTDFFAYCLQPEIKRVYYAIRIDSFRNEILRNIVHSDNDREFYKYVNLLTPQKLYEISYYYMKEIDLSYCYDFSFQYLNDVSDFTIIDEINAIFANIDNIVKEIMNNHEIGIINCSSNTKTKSATCLINYGKLKQRLYKKFCVHEKHGQILDKHNIFSKDVLLSYIHNFFYHYYENFTLNICDMV